MLELLKVALAGISYNCIIMFTLVITKMLQQGKNTSLEPQNVWTSSLNISSKKYKYYNLIFVLCLDLFKSP